MIRDFITALTLLTVLPAPAMNGQPPRPLGKSLAWFPLVGLLLGLVLLVAIYLLRSIFPVPVAAALTVALWAWLTGALHLEGLADSGDGLAATVSREKRLEIMHDPRVGSFGVVTVTIALVVKFAAVASLRSMGLLVLAPLLARWAMVVAATFPPASSKGMAVLFRDGLGKRDLVVATLVTAVIVGVFAWEGLAAFACAVAALLVVVRMAMSKLGGLNGDIYGAIGEVVEVIVLLVGTAVV
jgi:adenosylcobinamide-GDP ribazoletransferase